MLLEGDIGVSGIGQFFMWYFGIFNLELRYRAFSKPAGCVFFAFWSTIVAIKTYPSLFFLSFLAVSGGFGSNLKQAEKT